MEEKNRVYQSVRESKTTPGHSLYIKNPTREPGASTKEAAEGNGGFGCLGL
jgi:hypothetical protein